MEPEKNRKNPRLWQLGLCFLLFLGAVFFRSLSGRVWNPTGGAETLRELAGKVGETLAQSPLVEAFAEGFREGSHGNVVEAAGTAKTTAASQTAPSEGAAKATDKASEKATTTVAETTAPQSSLPLLTKRAGGKP